MTNVTRIGRAEVQNSRRYIEKLCKHWAHKLDISLDDDSARVVFPKEEDDPDYPQDAIAVFRTTESRLDVQLTAFTLTQVEALCGVIDDHLDRFASRDGGLRLTWEPA
jgi:uncharacterized protein